MRTKACGVVIVITIMLSPTLLKLQTFTLIQIEIIWLQTCPLSIETFSISITIILRFRIE